METVALRENGRADEARNTPVPETDTFMQFLHELFSVIVNVPPVTSTIPVEESARSMANVAEPAFDIPAKPVKSTMLFVMSVDWLM